MKCQKCGADNPPGARFCHQCGQELASATPTCPNCHAQVVPGAVFCSHCGQPLGSSAPVPGTGQAPVAAPIVMQTAVGDDNLQLNFQNINGSQIDVTINPVEKPTALRLPVEVRPAVFSAMLDRQPELQDVTRNLEMRAPVEISGQPGLGKTSLLRTVGNSPVADVGRFPGGVVYHRALGQPEPDLLQSIFSLFYRLPKDYKPSAEEIHRGLNGLWALVLLDDVSLTPDQLTDLRNQAPNCTFVLASTERALWGEGRNLALGGLPQEDGLRLIERELGRALTPQEQPAARQLCDALKGNPDQLLKTAARAREGQTLESILQALNRTPLTPVLLSGLSKSEMRLLSVLALGRGAAIPLEHLAPLADLPDVQPSLQVLQQRRLVQANSPSYSLTGTLAQELWRDWDLTPWAERAQAYFTPWAEAQSPDPRRLFTSLDVILRLLEWAVGNQHWAQVLRLGRAVQVALALSLRWGAWLQVLNWVLMAARALGERGLEGWALHQIGSHALCVGNRPAAHTFLTQALQLRQAIGDQAGAAVTQHNLNVLLGPLAPPSQGKPSGPRQPPSTPSGMGSALKWILPLIGVTGLAVAAVVIGVFWHPWTRTTPTSTRVPSVPTRTPTQHIPPPANLDFQLEGGCDRDYPPGTRATFVYIPSLDGWVTVSLDGEVLPDVNRKQVRGNTKYSGQVLIPRLPGEHVLSAFYDLGTDSVARECRFTVEEVLPPTPIPEIGIWLEPGQCGGRYAPGDPIGIHVRANQDGRVDFTIHPPADTSDTWYPLGDLSSLEVQADQDAVFGWQAPRDYGGWILRASLNDGTAVGECDLQVVEKNPPTLNEIALVSRLPCEEQVVDVFVFVSDDSGIEDVKLFSRLSYENNYSEVVGSRLDDFSYQFTFFASMEGGSQFYLDISDVNGNVISTREKPNAVYSGFVSSGIDEGELYCNAYLIWPNTDLPGMDLPFTPPVTENVFGCMTQCVGNLSCQSFTWDAATNICWMKNGVPAPAPKEQCTSGKEFSVSIP